MDSAAPAATVEPPAAPVPTGAVCTLGAVIDALGAGVVRVVTAPRGLDVAVGEPVVHDPLAEPSPRPGDLLLAVGVEPDRGSAVDLVRQVGRAGVVAVLVKDDGELPSGLVTVAEDGVFRKITTTDEVVRVPPLDELASAARLVVGVRAGGEALGSIWVQEGDRPLGPDAGQALRDAAGLAALHLLRARSGEDLERRRSGDELRAVLQGRLPASLLAETLSVRTDAPLVVLGLAPVEVEAADSGLLVDRLADFLVFSCTAFRRRVVAAGVGRAAYAVLAARSGGPEEARQLAADLAALVSAGLRMTVRAAVTDSPGGLSALLECRREVDLALRVQAGRGLPRPVHVSDVRAATVLLSLRDLTADRPALLAGRVRLLEESDRTRGTAYTATLRAFLDAFGDVRLAAEAVGVHPNTFRYRLRRLRELADLDLDDAEERLVAQLQLHLLAP